LVNKNYLHLTVEIAFIITLTLKIPRQYLRDNKLLTSRFKNPYITELNNAIHICIRKMIKSSSQFLSEYQNHDSRWNSWPNINYRLVKWIFFATQFFKKIHILSIWKLNSCFECFTRFKMTFWTSAICINSNFNFICCLNVM
jgi:hypothetical protein